MSYKNTLTPLKVSLKSILVSFWPRITGALKEQ